MNDPPAPMQGDIRIRPAIRGDLDALGRLGALLVRLHHGFDSDRFIEPGTDTATGYAWFLGTQLTRDDAVVLVAERAGVVVGYAFASLEPASWMELREAAGFIHDVVVDDAARGQGAGSLLVEAAAHWLEEHGAPRIILWTAEKNERAQTLFARLGFRRTMLEMTRERTGRS